MALTAFQRDVCRILAGRRRAGEAVLTSDGQLFRGRADELDRSLAVGEVAFHAGRLGGALPQIKG